MSWGETKTIWDRIDRVDDVTGAQGLYSDNHIIYDMVFAQDNIGARLNKMFNLNSPALASCKSVEQIADDLVATRALAMNAGAKNIAIKNSVLKNAMVNAFTDDEIVAYGLSQQKWNVGDIVKLTYNGVPTNFIYVAKNYVLSNSSTFMANSGVGQCQYASSTDSTYQKYSSSNLRNYLNLSVLPLFSELVQSAMLSPKFKYYYKTSADSTTTSPTQYEECSDKVWIPSNTELVIGNATYTRDATPSEKFPAIDINSKFKGWGNSYTTYNYWLRTMSYNGYGRYFVAQFTKSEYFDGYNVSLLGSSLTATNYVRPCFMVKG